MAIILPSDRPAFVVAGGRLEVGGDQPGGKAILDGARPDAVELLERAAGAVGRVEIEGGVFPWVGTAFLVAPRLAITARYVADGLTTGAKGAPPPTGFLNFADDPRADPPRRVAVAAVEHVHPRWPFCFLVLATDAGVAPLAIAPAPADVAGMTGSAIAVIGYSSFDQRNDTAVQARIFGDRFDVKRASPGRIIGAHQEIKGKPQVLLHDASTLGGSGGAPVVDIASGAVVGIHVSGHYLQGNHAAPAWDTRSDPQWLKLWAEKASPVVPPAPAPPAASARSRRIFSFEELTAITDWLIEARIADDAGLQTLFLGLSPEFMGSVPSAQTIADRLALALDFLNDARLRFGDRPPLYYVLTNARRRRLFEPDAVRAMDGFLLKVGQSA